MYRIYKLPLAILLTIGCSIKIVREFGIDFLLFVDYKEYAIQFFNELGINKYGVFIINGLLWVFLGLIISKI
jgi:hypothetical protein